MMDQTQQQVGRQGTKHLRGVAPDAPRACIVCRTIKPADAFYRKNGRRHRKCKACVSEQRRAEAASFDIVKDLPVLKKMFFERLPKGVSDSECWVWAGSIHHFKNYPVLGYKSRMIRAHRLSYLIHYGELHDDAYVCHRCDNPPCVNPHHLFLGDNSVNQLDAVSKGRHHNGRQTHCKHGHEFTPENTYIYTGVRYQRRCKACQRRMAKQPARFKGSKSDLRRILALRSHGVSVRRIAHATGYDWRHLNRIFR